MKFFLIALILSPSILFANVVDVAGYRFMAPDSWKQTEPSSSMRKAQFGVSTQLNSKILSTPAEGSAANVDRWMKQFKDIQRNRRKNCGRSITYARNWHFFEWISIWSQDPKTRSLIIWCNRGGKPGINLP